MAERPVFIPAPGSAELVREVYLSIKWHPGFAPVQKEKNIRELHNAAAAAGYSNVLEVSTKSQNLRGQHLSAFYLKVKSESFGDIPLECAFQGSKVFQRGGPFTDLYTVDPRTARKDKRLRECGALLRFQFEGFNFPLEPKTAFYDWLYATCIYPHREWATKLYAYDGFTDIEFNPNRSINCQARSIALFLSLLKLKLLDNALESPATFTKCLLQSRYRPSLHGDQASNLF